MKTPPKSEPPQLSVIYEDNHLLVVDKPAGMLSQSDRPDASDDLLSLARQYIKIKYITQLPTPSPTFVFFCNLPQYIKEAYERFLINKIREHFGFEGVAITVFFRKK